MRAVILIFAYVFVIFHGMIPHHHHDDVPVDIDIAHVHSHTDLSEDVAHFHSDGHHHHSIVGINIAEDNVPSAHHHNHFHILSNGFSHIERCASEQEFDDFKKLSLELFYISANNLGRYFCRDDCSKLIVQDIVPISLLFNNVKGLRGPPNLI